MRKRVYQKPLICHLPLEGVYCKLLINNKFTLEDLGADIKKGVLIQPIITYSGRDLIS